MHDSERYKRGQDLIFQEMEEKALLQQQTITGERAELLIQKIAAAHVSASVVSGMMSAGQTYSDIIGFLDTEIQENLVKTLMSARAANGKPISEEMARHRVRLMMAEE